jgi:threonine/homoserine/homoserine lactone efflux protein
MTITSAQLFLYFGALVILFLTPGPVWIAIIARTVSGGVKSGFSLVLGVSLGDLLWPIMAYFGLGLLISLYSDILILVRYMAAIILVIMGIQTILASRKGIKANDDLTKSGFFAGFTAGLIAVTANPKATLFYLTLLPSFFNFGEIGLTDLAIISGISFAVPMLGNILMILFLAKAKTFLSSPSAVRVTNIISGILLVVVGIVIGIT